MWQIFLDKKKRNIWHSVKDVRNFFRFKKEIDDAIFKNIRNHFRLKKGNKAIKDKIIRDIINLFEHGEENYYKPVRLYNF